MERCEFCGQERQTASGNSFHGGYCSECLRIEIEQAKECLKELKPSKKEKVSNDEIAKLKNEADAALANLINFGSKN